MLSKKTQPRVAAKRTGNARTLSLIDVENPTLARMPDVRTAMPILRVPKTPSRTRLPTVADYTRIADKWDRGNRLSRESMLKEFVRTSVGKSADHLERDFAGAASLFLTRISAWLRLTYLLGNDLTTTIQSLSIFISSTGGHRFIAEFLEIGGVLTLLEILGLSQTSDKDKTESLSLLLHIAHAGRRHKEFICESFGIRSIADCLSRSRDEISQDTARTLLYELGQDNPKYLMQVYKSLLSLMTLSTIAPSALRMASQALRGLLPDIRNIHTSIIEGTLSLLKHSHTQVQHEGYEILRELIHHQDLQDTLLTQLISILKTPVTYTSQDDSAEGSGSGPSGEDLAAATLFSDVAEQTLERSGPVVAPGVLACYVQQAYAAKLLGLVLRGTAGVMAAISADLAEQMVQMQVISALLNTLANVAHPESQKFASNTLLYLAENHDAVVEVLKSTMGSNFFEVLKARPDTFYSELTKEQIRMLKRTSVKIEVNENGDTIGSSGMLDDEHSNSDSESEDSDIESAGGGRLLDIKNEDDHLNAIRSKLSFVTEKNKKEEPLRDNPKEEDQPEDGDKDEIPPPTIQELFIPYGQVSQSNTGGQLGNKFAPETAASMKADERERFRARRMHQKEFKLKVSPGEISLTKRDGTLPTGPEQKYPITSNGGQQEQENDDDDAGDE
ncbi:hypothetical protein M427DRAFT_30594 [Gonapodya prolifera JEL478]|uniref:ARM repeat-containing protein n=1 Tax=Gonapodya prolifera (strain JEL478) TaxID=1344416 RepID=A0A139AK04_GONPJ|nr:hypothetical protein M427DRAFT_30594 [Gonapodya prolifera JEL478]|eukprot:KXS17112.1 hypothetical protein M427DRAFT_30594 [Gonapodya prolifera JEL478]